MPDEHEGASKGALIPAGDPEDDQPPMTNEIIKDLIKIEKERIRSQDRRTEVALKAVEASDASDKRQFEYHTQRLQSEERRATARVSLGLKVAFGIGAVVVAILVISFYMLFFGAPTQTDYAEKLLTWFFAALGGGGLFVLLQRGLQWVMKSL